MAQIRPVPEQFTQGWLTRLDGRTAIAQEMTNRWQILTDDLGGADALSYAQRSLAERALWLEFWLGQQEQALAAGGAEFDIGKWTQACNALQGILSKLGLERRAKDVPNLEQFLKQRASA